MKLGLVFFLGNEFYLSNNFVNFNSSAIIFRLVANVKDLIIFREWNTCAKSAIAQLVLLVVSTKMFNVQVLLFPAIKLSKKECYTNK